MSRTILFILLVLLCAANVSDAVAQNLQDLQHDLQNDQLQPIDEGIADIGPLGTSLRQLQSGLNQPTGFANVYAVPGHPNLLMRVDGGLYAVFDQSIYSKSGPVIPNNTVFHIGPPMINPALTRQSSPNPDLLDSRISAKPIGRGPTTGEIDYESPLVHRKSQPAEAQRMTWVQTIVVEGNYRRSRLMELMHRAAAVDND